MSLKRSTITPTFGQEQLQLHCLKGADGKIQVGGLEPGQHLLRMPNEQLLVINQSQGKIALQPGVALIATGAENRPSAGTSLPITLSIGDKIRIVPKTALIKIQSQSQIQGSQEQMRKVKYIPQHSEI